MKIEYRLTRFIWSSVVECVPRVITVLRSRRMFISGQEEVVSRSVPNANENNFISFCFCIDCVLLRAVDDTPGRQGRERFELIKSFCLWSRRVGTFIGHIIPGYEPKLTLALLILSHLTSAALFELLSLSCQTKLQRKTHLPVLESEEGTNQRHGREDPTMKTRDLPGRPPPWPDDRQTSSRPPSWSK
jgi:hypothetical protein